MDSNNFKLFLLTGDGKTLLNTYDLSGMTKDNPEAICVDHVNNCIWVDDDDEPSRIFKIEFENL